MDLAEPGRTSNEQVATVWPVGQHAHDVIFARSDQEIELHAAMRHCLRGPRAMVSALASAIDYFSFVMWAREQGCIRKHVGERSSLYGEEFALRHW